MVYDFTCFIMLFNPETTVSEICAILQNDSDLKSFEIIPQSYFQNSSPVQYREHHLGLESWCVKDLYIYVHKRILTPNENKNEVDNLSVALLLNPNVKTFWNARKILLLSRCLDVGAELRFIALILSYKPKAVDLYCHRRWVLRTIFERNEVSSERFYKELDIVQTAALQHSNNHVAWSFATWLLDLVQNGNILQTLWKISEQWISSNVSDYSSMHFRLVVLKDLINHKSNVDDEFKCEIVEAGLNYLTNTVGYSNNYSSDDYDDMLFVISLIIVDLKLSEELISFYGNHESLWHYRKTLCYFLVKVLPEKLSEIKVKPSSRTISKLKFLNNLALLLQRIDEIFLKNVKKSACDHLIRAYNLWIKHFELYSISP